MFILTVLALAMLSSPAEDAAIPLVSEEQDSRCPKNQVFLEDECVKRPKQLKKKFPRYPDLARRAKVQGVVELIVVLQPDGTIGDIQVTKGPDGKLGFEEAAIEAVKQWRYEPVVVHGKPIPIRFKVIVDFHFTN